MSSVTIIYYPPIEISNHYSSSCHAMCHINYLYSLFIYTCIISLYIIILQQGEIHNSKIENTDIYDARRFIFS